MCSGALVSGTMAANASEKASNAATVMTMLGIDEQRRQYNQTRTDQMPWMTAGSNALTKLVDKVNAGPGEFTKSPGYDFRLAEGEKALTRNAAATGGTQSGKTMKALTRFGQDYATNDYDNFLRRYYESLNPLQSISGLGQTTGAQVGQLGGQSANAISNSYNNLGTTQANAIMNESNAWSKAYNTATQNLVNYGQYAQWKNSQVEKEK